MLGAEIPGVCLSLEAEIPVSLGAEIPGFCSKV